MRSQVRQILLSMVVLLSAAACGGGGGGGGDTGSQFSGDLRVTVTAIDFSATRLGPAPASQRFNIIWSNPDVFRVVIGVPPGQTLPSWLDISAVGDASPVTVTVAIRRTDLDVGDYSVTLRVVSSDITGNSVSSIDVPVTYSVSDPFIVTPTQLSFDHVLANPQPPSDQSIDIRGAGVAWTATADQPWVTLGAASGGTPATLSVSVDPTGLPVGQQTATITVTNSNNTSETADVDVQLNISGPSAQLSRSALDVTVVNGAPIVPVNVDFMLDNAQATAWTAVASDPWIVLSETSWSGPSSVTISLDPSVGSLASGSYSGNVTFSTSYLGSAITQVLPVDLELTLPTLTVSPGNLAFQGGPEADFEPQEIAISVNTGNNTYPWQFDFVTDNGTGWLGATVESGAVSSDRVFVPVTIDTTEQTEDRYTGSVDVTVTVNGDVLTATVPVDLILEPHRLFVADNGVALFDSPGLSKLSHTVTVSENRRITSAWTATSDQPWLTVTAAGTTDGDMVISADTTTLAAEQIHYANVTIESTTPTITNSGQEYVRVGVYVTATTPAAQVTTPPPMFSTSMVADPIRPYVYVARVGPDIGVYNVHTGALESTISNVGTDLRDLAISSDGDMLYATDGVGWQIVSIDLTGAEPVVNPAWTDPVWESCNCFGSVTANLNYARINGREVLLGGTRDIIDANTGVRLFGTGQSFFGDRIAVAVNATGSELFSADQVGTTHRVSRRVLTYSEIDDEFESFFTSSTERLIFSNRGVNTDPAGDLVFGPCTYAGGQLQIYDGFDLTTISTVNRFNPGSVGQYGPDGLVYCSRFGSPASGEGDVYAVDLTTRAIIAEYNVPDDIDEGFVTFSGDGLRLITISDDRSALTLTSIQ